MWTMNLNESKRNVLNNYYFKKIRKSYTGGNITVISSNCLGGKLYQILNMQYMSPFIGLYVPAPDFVELLSNLDERLSSKLKFTDNSKYKNINNSEDNVHPIGLLNDEIELHFLHYNSEEVAKNNWYRRLNRIDRNNIFITFTDRDNCTYETLVKFNDLPFEKKVCFTSKAYKLDSCIYLPEYKNNHSVGILTDDFYNTCRHFDWVKWLNGTKCSRSKIDCIPMR